MPMLPTFNASAANFSIGGGRRAAATDFGSMPEGVGHATQKAVASVLETKEEDEARKALVASSEIRAKYARELDDAALSGADVGALKERMQDDLNKIGEGFQTKKGMENLRLYTANSEIMFDEQANKINVTRAFSAARLDGQKFLKDASAIIQANPAYLKEAEINADEFAATFKGIRPEQRNEIADGLKKQLNMAAAIGAARADPEGTKKKLEAGEWDLTPEQREHGINRADTEMRAKRADEDHQRVLKEYDERKRDEAARDQHFGDIINGKATRRSIMDDADLRPATREHLIVFMEHRTKELQGQEKRSDPTVVRDLWLAANAAKDDPVRTYNTDAIFNAVHDGKLNTADADRLMAMVGNQKDENNRAFSQRLAARVQVLSSVMKTSPEFSTQPELAAAIQNEIIARVEQRSAAMRRGTAEKPGGNAPDSLLDPESKDYMFKPGFLKAVADDVKQQRAALMPQMPKVNTQAEYDALEPGTLYLDSKGKQGVKKGAAKSIKGAGPTVSGTIRTAQ